MKKNLLLSFFTILLMPFCGAQNNLVKQWDARFGGIYMDRLETFIQTNDGGYLLGGWAYSGINGDKTQPNWDSTYSTWDMWVVKTNSLGQKEWDRRFGGTDRDDLNGIAQTTDGGYILAGTTFSNISGDITQAPVDTLLHHNGDYWAIKIDALGNKEWDKRLGGVGSDFVRSMIATRDGGALLGGDSNSPPGGDKTQPNWSQYPYNNIWMVKIDAQGNKQWDKTFGGTKGEAQTCALETEDGGYLIGGVSGSDSSGNKTQANWDTTLNSGDMWIVKTDSLGNKQWDKRYGGSSIDGLAQIIKSTDGGYLLGGTSGSLVSGDKTQANWGSQYDYWIVKIDSVGSKEWDKVFGGYNPDYLQNITCTFDKGYLLSGISGSAIGGDKTENNLGQLQVWMVKTDSNGIKQWDKTVLFPDGDPNSGSSVNHGIAIQTKDSCYAAATFIKGGIGGYSSQLNRDTTNYTFDYWLVKFCEQATGINEIDNENSFTLYPNPTSNKLSIQLANGPSAKLAYQILTTDGRMLMQNTITQPKFEIDVNSLPVGLYFFQLQDDKQRWVKKFVKE